MPYRLQNCWEEIFDVSIPWQMVYELIRKTPDSKLTIFQCILLYKILATNRMLYMGDTNFPALQILPRREQVIRSFFWYCPYVACFWSQVQERLKNCNIYLELTLQIALLGDLKSHCQSINNITFKIFI